MNIITKFIKWLSEEPKKVYDGRNGNGHQPTEEGGVQPTKPWPRQEMVKESQDRINKDSYNDDFEDEVGWLGMEDSDYSNEPNRVAAGLPDVPAPEEPEITHFQQKCRDALSNRQKRDKDDDDVVTINGIVCRKKIPSMPKCEPTRSEVITRIEVIKGGTHKYVSYLNHIPHKVELAYQDDGKTLKIFLKEK